MVCTYTESQAQEIFQRAMNKLMMQFRLAKNNNSLDDFMEDYGIVYEESPMPVNSRMSKILVVGALSGKVNNFVISAKKQGIPESNIEFEHDFSKFHNINLARLEYSDKYSDIIFGPIPHSMAGKGDSSSIIAKMEKESDKYPRVIRACTSNELKLSITSFRKAIASTRYFMAMN